MKLIRSSAMICLLLLPIIAKATDYHFVNGRVITMTSVSGAEATAELWVRTDRIAAIGTDLPVPENAIRVDLKGGYLIPGLTEMHAHVPRSGQDPTYRDEVLFLYVANGVTTIRGMLGYPGHLALRDALISHEVLGPRLITSGPSFNGNSVSSPEQARQMVTDQADAGYDFLKIHPGLSRAEYDAIAETANGLELPFAGHVPAAVGLNHALASGQATIDHLDGFVQALVPDLGPDRSGLFAFGLIDRIDIDRIDDLVMATRNAGAAVVPTETLLENFAAAGNPQSVIDRPQNVYLPKALLASYQRGLAPPPGQTSADADRFLDLRKRLIRQLHDGGVMLLLGSDAPQVFNVPGFSAHRELASMVAAGLEPVEALQLGTRNPALFFGAEDEFGTLAPGKAADLVWLAENPLTDITNSTSIRGVMVRGRWFDRSRLDEGLATIASRHGP